jgi:hypothetical protein
MTENTVGGSLNQRVDGSNPSGDTENQALSMGSPLSAFSFDTCFHKYSQLPFKLDWI